MKVTIYDTGSTLEAIAIKSMLESFDIKVETSYIGRPNQFINEVNNNDSDFIIICGHGEKDRF